MDWQMISLVGLIPAFAFGYAFGRGSVEYPSDEEMLQRIIRGRVEKLLREQVESDIKNEINRQAAGGNIPY
jgi:hypothetical protein